MFNLPRIPWWYGATGLLVIAFLAAGGWYYYEMANRITWTMIDVDNNIQEGSPHLLEFPDGTVMLIGAGTEAAARNAVIPFLEERGIEHLDHLVLVGASTSRSSAESVRVLLAGLRHVGTVHVNHDAGDLSETRRLAEQAGASLRPLETDGLLYHDDKHDIFIESVFVDDGTVQHDTESRDRARGELLRLVYGTTSVLFTGNTDRDIGDHLLANNFFLDSTIVTNPDHRSHRQPSEAFFGAVGAQAILASNSTEQWRASEPARRFAYDNDVPAYISGLHGHVVVTLKRDGFRVHTQREPDGN